MRRGALLTRTSSGGEADRSADTRQVGGGSPPRRLPELACCCTAFVWQLTATPSPGRKGRAWAGNTSACGRLPRLGYGFFQESGVYVVTHVLPFDTLERSGGAVRASWAIPVLAPARRAYMIVIREHAAAARSRQRIIGRPPLVGHVPVFITMAAVIPARQRGNLVRPSWRFRL